MTTLQLFGKWTLLVWLSAAFSVFMALTTDFDSAIEILGIILGGFTMVVLYSLVDLRLQQRGKTELRKWLLISVIIQILTQLLPFLQVMAGIASLTVIDFFISLFSLNTYKPDMESLSAFLISYFATVLCGLLLSILVVLLVCLTMLFMTKVLPRLKNRYKRMRIISN